MDRIKVKVFHHFLDNYPVVGVMVDRSKLREGRGIPAHVLPGHDFVILEYGKRLPRPIMDMVAAHDGLFAKLSFGGIYHFVEILWPAVVFISERPDGCVVAFNDGVYVPRAPTRGFRPQVLKGGKDG